MNKIVSENGSNSSGEFETFLKNIKRANKSKKYRLSTGSLSGFIVNTSSMSSEDHSKPPKPVKNSTKWLSHSEIPASRTRQRAWRKHPIKKSVATPMRSIVFSSDSEPDSVFKPSTSNHIKTLQENTDNLQTRLSFTDSDKENETGLQFNEPKILDFSSSTDESDNDAITHCPSITSAVPSFNSFAKPAVDVTNKEKKMSMNFSDSDDDVHFASLRDRLLLTPLQPKTRKTLADIQLKTSAKPNVHRVLTPQNKPIQKYFHTENPRRVEKKVCLVENCFLSSLDSFKSQNSCATFKKSKVELTARLAKFYNLTVFDNQLPESLEISWAKRLTKTAGVTKCRRITKSYKDDLGNVITSQSYEASISLSDKVIDCAYRLRDTLIHEMCHAAVWLINHVNEGHGPFWKSWAAKARRVHPELPMIDRCHNYDIEYKYRYQCTR